MRRIIVKQHRNLWSGTGTGTRTRSQQRKWPWEGIRTTQSCVSHVFCVWISALCFRTSCFQALRCCAASTFSSCFSFTTQQIKHFKVKRLFNIAVQSSLTSFFNTIFTVVNFRKTLRKTNIQNNTNVLCLLKFYTRRLSMWRTGSISASKGGGGPSRLTVLSKHHPGPV